jgi:hypothetical protein
VEEGDEWRPLQPGIAAKLDQVIKTKIIRTVHVSVSDPDPDSIRLVDPDSESGPGSRRAKMTNKKKKKSLEISCF